MSIPIATTVVPAITATMGIADALPNVLTATDPRAPMPICKVPSSDEAVPAFLSKGARASAAALG